jgi:hypothetical protein
MPKKKVKRTQREENILKECRSLIRKNPKLKRKKLHRMKNLDKRLYYIKVWVITESQPLHKLKNSDKRCYMGKGCYHLDHICSIAEGYRNNFPPEVIGHIDNLRFIPAEENMKKGSKVSRYRLQETKKKSRKFKEK